MAIFGQFTKRAQQVLMTAQECATREGQPYVGTLHFLYGLLDVGEAPESVTRHIQKEDVKQVLDQIDDEVSLHPGHGPVQMTPRARRVLDGSIIESRRLGQLYVGTEHMWLGILANPNCKAAELLAHRLRGGFLRRFGSRLLLICHVGGHVFLRLLRGLLLLIHRSLSAFLPFHCYLSSFLFFCGA